MSHMQKATEGCPGTCFPQRRRNRRPQKIFIFVIAQKFHTRGEHQESRSQNRGTRGDGQKVSCCERKKLILPILYSTNKTISFGFS